MLTLERSGDLSLSVAFLKGALEACSNGVLLSHLVLQIGISEWLGYCHNTGGINKTPGQKKNKTVVLSNSSDLQKIERSLISYEYFFLFLSADIEMQGRKKIISVEVKRKTYCCSLKSRRTGIDLNTQDTSCIFNSFTNNLKFNGLFLIFLDCISWQFGYLY